MTYQRKVLHLWGSMEGTGAYVSAQEHTARAQGARGRALTSCAHRSVGNGGLGGVVLFGGDVVFSGGGGRVALRGGGGAVPLVVTLAAGGEVTLAAGGSVGFLMGPGPGSRGKSVICDPTWLPNNPSSTKPASAQEGCAPGLQ